MEVLRPAWRSQAGLLTLIAATIVATLGGAFWLVEGGALLAVAGIPLALVLMLVLLYRHYSHRYYIEEGRIEHEVGLLGRHIRSVRLRDVRNVNLRQGILERILGIGTLEFSSAGGGGVEVSWDGVRDPAGIKRRVEALRERRAES